MFEQPNLAAPNMDLESQPRPSDLTGVLGSPSTAETAEYNPNSPVRGLIFRRKGQEDVGESQLGIVKSAQHLGYATSALLLISTLTFGFAIAAIVELTAAHVGRPLLSDVIVLLFLSGAASLSVVTTTFGLLEYYYLEMFAGADEFCRCRDADIADGLEGELKAVLRAFNQERARARNAMWGALILTQLAATVQLNRSILLELGLNPGGGIADDVQHRAQAEASQGLPYHLFGDFMASLMQIASVVKVILTVKRFRRDYRPLLLKYKLGYG